MNKNDDYRGLISKSNKRTQQEIDADFAISARLLAQGSTWQEIASAINSERPYTITAGHLHSVYNIRLKNAALQRAPGDELERVIDDLDAVMFKALKAWNDSIGEVHVVTTKGIVQFDDENNPTGQITTEETIKAMQQNGDAAYLNVYLKALEKKTKLLGMNAPAQLDLNLFLKNLQLDDSSEHDVLPPITSEEEAKRFGEKLRDKPEDYTDYEVV